VRKVDNLITFMCRMSWKSGSLNLLEPSGPHRAYYGTALPLPFLGRICNKRNNSNHMHVGRRNKLDRECLLTFGPESFVLHFAFQQYCMIVFDATAPGGSGPPHLRDFLVTHNDALHLVGLLWTSDYLVAEICT